MSGLNVGGSRPELVMSTDTQASFIDAHSTVEGTIQSQHDLRIEGTVHGRVHCDGILMVSQGAHVDAEVDAADIIVSGALSGVIRCRGRLEIRASGSVSGDVTTNALVIVEGARYEGQIAMVSSPKPEPGTVDEDPETTSEPVSGGNYGLRDEYPFLRRFGGRDTADDGDQPDQVDDADDPDRTSR
jgi:cytoskeletal protein CcmA (bactofilin family)